MAYRLSLRFIEFAVDYATAGVLVFAVPANIINILVFWKDGFKLTPNISFFVLAITDLLISIFDVPYLLRVYTTFVTHAVPVSEALNTIGAWITAVITMERLCCIAFPLKVIF